MLCSCGKPAVYTSAQCESCYWDNPPLEEPSLIPTDSFAIAAAYSDLDIDQLDSELHTLRSERHTLPYSDEEVITRIALAEEVLAIQESRLKSRLS